MEIRILNETAAINLATAAGCSVEEYVNALINQAVEAEIAPENGLTSKTIYMLQVQSHFLFVYDRF